MAIIPHHPSQDTRILKAQLLEQLPRLVECLFAGRNVHRTAYEYRVGTQGSVSIRLVDGSYFNHESGKGGDLFTLIQHVFKTDFKGALVWARGFVGHTANVPASPLPDALQQKIDERAARQRDKALAMLRRSIPIKGTLADTYLRKYRGITLQSLPVPLRFIAHAYNYTAGRYSPAMIVGISDSAGQITAAHCTFLDPVTGNKLQGDGIKPRLIFGPYRDCALRLAEATDRLALCEGIEDGLSIMQCSLEWPVWATGGTSGLRTVRIPPGVQEVMICADGDAPGTEAAKSLSARLISEGKRVRIATPPEGVKDFNDLLRQGAGHAE